jgi:xanthine/uracil permease
MSIELVYDLDEKPRSTRDIIVYSWQWIVTMFYCVIWGYAIVGVGLELTGEVLARYMATIVLMIGVSTLVQTYFGHRFTMVSGPNVIPSLAITAAMQIGGKDYALMAFTAQAIAGVVVAILGAVGLIGYISEVWSNLVLGSMVMMVGLSIAGTGLSLLTAQGPGWPFFVGLGLALLAGIISIKGKGVVSTLPTLVVVVIGYAIFIIAGRFDWAFINELPLFILPQPFPFGIQLPPWDLILTMIIVNFMAALNLYGNVTGWGSIVGHSVEKSQMKRSFSLFGLIETTLAGILGVPGHVAYGENLGIITLTRVASRYFLLFGSAIFLIASFFGPMGGFMAAMPDPIAGAILLGIASTVIGQGADIWNQEKFERREIMITGFSVFLSYGLSILPDSFWDQVPRLLATVFSNPIITVILVVITLEQIFFRKEDNDQNSE